VSILNVSKNTSLSFMRLTNFQIVDDSIALNYKGQYLDLHNCFDFRSFHYDVTTSQLELIWTRSHEEWANESIPAFKLVFHEVGYLRIRERDGSMPATEDSCLYLIGFLQQELRDEFDSYTEFKNVTESDDLNISFQGGQAFKINCSYADFVELNEEIIYVLITNDGVDVWRPIWADKLEDGIYKLKSFPDYDPTDEELQFKTGDIVVCEKQKKINGTGLIAVSKKK
jgi:hypothetical protein